MKVNELEGKDAYLLLFGGGTLSALIVLLSIYVGHVLTLRSNVPTVVQVQPALSAPTVSVKMPEAQTPVVNVSPAVVDVHVPQQQPPTVNITTPQPLVQLMPAQTTAKVEVEKKEDRKDAKPLSLPPLASPTIPEPKPTGDAHDKQKDELEQALATPSIDVLYKYADSYLTRFCEQRGLDASSEAKRWNTAWESRLADHADTSEQVVMNNVCVEKRNNFKVDSATPEQIAEGCRLLLRCRDHNLALLSAMQEAATPDNLRKTITVLASIGSK
jgi:hypothetical protein